MHSILEINPSNNHEETIEEMVLYDHIYKLMPQAEASLIYNDNDNAFKTYASIKAILILFEACGLEVDSRYWEWLAEFSEELMPNLK